MDRPASDREFDRFMLGCWKEETKAYLDAATQRTDLPPQDANEPFRVVLAPIEMRRSWWTTQAFGEFELLAEAADRLLSAHASTAAAERNWSKWRRVIPPNRSTLGKDLGEQMVATAHNLNHKKGECAVAVDLVKSGFYVTAGK